MGLQATYNYGNLNSATPEAEQAAQTQDEMCLFCLLPRWVYPNGSCCSWNRADGTPKNAPGVFGTKELGSVKRGAEEIAAGSIELVKQAGEPLAFGVKWGLFAAILIIGGAVAWKIKEF